MKRYKHDAMRRFTRTFVLAIFVLWVCFLIRSPAYAESNNTILVKVHMSRSFAYNQDMTVYFDGYMVGDINRKTRDISFVALSKEPSHTIQFQRKEDRDIITSKTFQVYTNTTVSISAKNTSTEIEISSYELAPYINESISNKRKIEIDDMYHFTYYYQVVDEYVTIRHTSRYCDRYYFDFENNIRANVSCGVSDHKGYPREVLTKNIAVHRGWLINLLNNDGSIMREHYEFKNGNIYHFSADGKTIIEAYRMHPADIRVQTMDELIEYDKTLSYGLKIPKFK